MWELAARCCENSMWYRPFRRMTGARWRDPAGMQDRWFKRSTTDQLCEMGRAVQFAKFHRRLRMPVNEDESEGEERSTSSTLMHIGRKQPREPWLFLSFFSLLGEAHQLQRHIPTGIWRTRGNDLYMIRAVIKRLRVYTSAREHASECPRTSAA